MPVKAIGWQRTLRNRHFWSVGCPIVGEPQGWGMSSSLNISHGMQSPKKHSELCRSTEYRIFCSGIRITLPKWIIYWAWNTEDYVDYRYRWIICEYVSSCECIVIGRSALPVLYLSGLNNDDSLHWNSYVCCFPLVTFPFSFNTERILLMYILHQWYFSLIPIISWSWRIIRVSRMYWNLIQQLKNLW